MTSSRTVFDVILIHFIIDCFIMSSQKPLTKKLFSASLVLHVAISIVIYHCNEEKKEESEIWSFLPRQHNTFHGIYNVMGPTIFCQAYHMMFNSFWCLLSILSPPITQETEGIRTYKKNDGRDNCYMLPPVQNGAISSSMWLACCIQYATGGSYGIMIVYGISYIKVLNSLWIVVDAINKCTQFNISYPASLEKQREMQQSSRQQANQAYQIVLVPSMLL